MIAVPNFFVGLDLLVTDLTGTNLSGEMDGYV